MISFFCDNVTVERRPTDRQGGRREGGRALLCKHGAAQCGTVDSRGAPAQRVLRGRHGGGREWRREKEKQGGEEEEGTEKGRERGREGEKEGGSEHPRWAALTAVGPRTVQHATYPEIRRHTRTRVPAPLDKEITGTKASPRAGRKEHGERLLKNGRCTTHIHIPGIMVSYFFKRCALREKKTVKTHSRRHCKKKNDRNYSSKSLSVAGWGSTRNCMRCPPGIHAEWYGTNEQHG